MRVLVFLAVVALAAVAGLLLYDRPHERTAAAPPAKQPAVGPETSTPPEPERAEPPREKPLPDIEAAVRKRPRAPRAQQELKSFVAACVARGEAAVPHLVWLLRGGKDVIIARQFAPGPWRGEAYPTLRAAYLHALASIPGEEAKNALREVLEGTGSIAEMYWTAEALGERGESGWANAVLKRAAAQSDPADLRFQKGLVALAARAAPEKTAAEIVARAPRAVDAADPQVLAEGLRALPLGAAVGAAEQLLADQAITARAKARYLRSLTGREEPQVFAHLRDAMQRANWTDSLKIDVAYAAAGAEAFFLEQIAFSQARAKGDAIGAARIRSRFERRLREVELLVRDVVGQPEPGADARADSLRRMLERHAARIK